MRRWHILALAASLLSSSRLPAQLPRRARPDLVSAAAAETTGLQSNEVGFFTTVGKTLWLSSGRRLSRMTGQGSTQFDWATLEVASDSTRQDEGITGFAVSGSRMAVATAHSEQVQGKAVGVGDAIYLSGDGGNSWKRYSITTIFLDRAGMTIPGGDTQCFGVAFDGTNLWATFTSEYAVMTPDDGTSWYRYRPDSTNNPQPNPFLQDPTRIYRYYHLNYRAFDVAVLGQAIWTSTNAGINRSLDGGMTWSNFDAYAYGISGDFVPTLFPDTTTGILWAATQSTGIDEAQLRDDPNYRGDYFPDGVWNSLDWDLDRDGHADGAGRDGVSWSADGGATWHTYIPVDDPAVGQDVRAWGFATHGNTVWVAGSTGGYDALLRSDDVGRTWRLTPIVTAAGDTVTTRAGATDVAYTDGLLWVSTARGLLRSDDDGATWRFVLRYPQTEMLGVGGVANTAGPTSGLPTYAFPSPCAPRLGSPPMIVFALAKGADVTVDIYDSGGGFVRRLRAPGLGAGNQTLEWNGETDDGRDVANGVYLYLIRTSDGHSARGKIMVSN